MNEKSHYVADEDELETDGSKIIVEVGGQEIAVFHFDDEYFAVANYCPHQAAPLCEGKQKGKVEIADDDWDLEYSEEAYIECPWHSWTFDIRSGENASDERYRVPTYEIEVEDGEIHVLK